MRVCERTASRGGANKDQRVLETAQTAPVKDIHFFDRRQ